MMVCRSSVFCEYCVGSCDKMPTRERKVVSRLRERPRMCGTGFCSA